MQEAAGPGGSVVVVEVDGVWQILLLETKVKIELITPSLQVEEQIPVVGLLTVEVIGVVLQVAVLVEVAVVEQAEVLKTVLEMTSTHQET